MKISLSSASKKQFEYLYDKLGNIERCYEYLTKIINIKTENRLINIPYQTFLSTVYWQIISKYKKHKNPACENCGSKYRLNIHHINYEFRGMEWKYLDCLKVLCRHCHENISYINLGKDNRAIAIINDLAQSKQFTNDKNKEKRQFRRYLEKILRT